MLFWLTRSVGGDLLQLLFPLSDLPELVSFYCVYLGSKAEAFSPNCHPSLSVGGINIPYIIKKKMVFLLLFTDDVVSSQCWVRIVLNTLAWARFLSTAPFSPVGLQLVVVLTSRREGCCQARRPVRFCLSGLICWWKLLVPSLRKSWHKSVAHSNWEFGAKEHN